MVLSLSTLLNTSGFPMQHAISYARAHLVDVLSRGIVCGRLAIVEGSQTYHFGICNGREPKAMIIVLDKTFWIRLFLKNDVGFAESFLLGEIESDNLKAVHELWLANTGRLTRLSSPAYVLYATISKLANYLVGQSLSNARLNAAAGYNESNALFQAFLSQEMMYSCALWGEEEGGADADLRCLNLGQFDLETAQQRKIHYVLKRARVKKGDRILEFGSGWCALAIEAARTYGCSVDTLTLSTAQKELGEKRIHEAGLTSLIRVHLMDYRQLPASFERSFDRFISVEMIEHVGPKHYNEFFKIINWALKPDRASAVITSSTMPESRYSEYQYPDFGRCYIWPNGTLPSSTALISAAYHGSHGQLTLDSVENHGKHYARTLREWDCRFRRNFNEGVVTAVLQDRPDLADVRHLEAFRRKWIYLFAYAEAGFSHGYVTCHMLTFVRERNSVED